MILKQYILTTVTRIVKKPVLGSLVLALLTIVVFLAGVHSPEGGVVLYQRF
jgi:hypothetical protein